MTIEDAYLKLNSPKLNEHDWFNLSRYFRFDPRFFEAAILKFSEDYENVNPVKLNLFFQQSSTPALLGVFADLSSMVNTTPPFKTFKKMLLVQIKKSSTQIFYLNLHPLKPDILVELILNSNNVFNRWGFAEVDLPLNKYFLMTNRTSISKAQRLRILSNFIKTKSRIRTKDYLQEIKSKGYLISQRVAELDLKFCNNLKACEQTKGRYYLVKKPYRAVCPAI